MKRELLYVLVLLVTALLLRCAFIVLYDGGKFLTQEYYSSDSIQYDTAASNVMSGKGFLSIDGNRARIGPVYPLFLAGVFAVFGHSMVAVRCAQVVMGTLTCLLFYGVARNIFNASAAAISLFMSAVYYPMIQMPAYIMADELNLFLIAALLFLVTNFLSAPSAIKAVCVGLVYGLSVLCKGALFGFFPLFLVCLLVVLQVSLIRRIAYVCLVALSLFLVILPWGVRNYRIFHKFIPVTIHTGDLLYKGNSPEATGGSGGFHKRGIDFVDAPDNPGTNEYERDMFLKNKAVAYIKNNPKRCMQLACVKFWNMWRPYHTDTRFISKVVMCCSYLPIVLFAFIGIMYSMREWRKYLLFYLLLGYYAGVHMVLIGIIRYRYPMEPILILFASYGAVELYRKWRRGATGLRATAH